MRKAQAAMEYLMITAVALVIIIPTVYLIYDYATSAGKEVTTAQVGKIGNTISQEAEKVYYLGKPSKTTIKVNMPANVFNITVVGNTELVFFVGDPYSYEEIVIPLNINIVSYLNPLDFSPGVKYFRMEAEEDYVALYTGDYAEAIILKQVYDTGAAFIAGAAELKTPLISGNMITESAATDVAFLRSTSSVSSLQASVSAAYTTLLDNTYIWIDDAPNAAMPSASFDPIAAFEISPSGAVSYGYPGNFNNLVTVALTDANNFEILSTASGSGTYEFTVTTPTDTYTGILDRSTLPRDADSLYWHFGDPFNDATQISVNYANPVGISTTPISQRSAGLQKDITIPDSVFAISIDNDNIKFIVDMSDTSTRTVAVDSYIGLEDKEDLSIGVCYDFSSPTGDVRIQPC